jgi:hypothetical protein
MYLMAIAATAHSIHLASAWFVAGKLTIDASASALCRRLAYFLIAQ